jgi:hypothetical protein
MIFRSSLNSASASPAIKDAFSGTITDHKDVASKGSASMRASSDFLSNEIDESDLQYEKHSEQRI